MTSIKMTLMTSSKTVTSTLWLLVSKWRSSKKSSVRKSAWLRGPGKSATTGTWVWTPGREFWLDRTKSEDEKCQVNRLKVLSDSSRAITTRHLGQARHQANGSLLRRLKELEERFKSKGIIRKQEEINITLGVDDGVGVTARSSVRLWRSQARRFESRGSRASLGSRRNEAHFRKSFKFRLEIDEKRRSRSYASSQSRCRKRFGAGHEVTHGQAARQVIQKFHQVQFVT